MKKYYKKYSHMKICIKFTVYPEKKAKAQFL